MVIGVDLVPERLERARAHGVDVVNLAGEDVVAEIREKTAGRGPDAVVDASAWRRTARRSASSPRTWSPCCPTGSPRS
jgi:threonine dehydrogenase-like Zn-dependent dehydrogenase